MKVGDLVRFCNLYYPDAVESSPRKMGIIISFDKDDDPIVFWFDPSFFGQPEANFRKHIVMLSEC